jgi:hypothetical protein
MSDQPKNPEKSISEQLSDILAQLSRDQLRFITAMQDYPTKREAAEAVGLEPNTIYKWPKAIDDALLLIARDREASVREVLRRNALKAVMVKVAGLDSDEESIRQKVAPEIIESVIGKPTQKQEVGGPGGAPLQIEYIYVDPTVDDPEA